MVKKCPDCYKVLIVAEAKHNCPGSSLKKGDSTQVSCLKKQGKSAMTIVEGKS